LCVAVERPWMARSWPRWQRWKRARIW
jgi:hypothetical protein